MADVGMQFAVYSPITAETAESAITYGTGASAGESISANISYNNSNSDQWADNVRIEIANGITGYTIDFETAMLSADVRKALLGYKSVTGSGSTITHYDVTDAPAPYVGFGFVQDMEYKGVHSYEARWYHKVRFTQNTEAAKTKREQVEFGSATINGTGVGVKIDNSGDVKFNEWMTFSTLAEAKAWLKGKANITP